jgi:hypothetical protein
MVEDLQTNLSLHSADTQVFLDERHFRRSWWACMVCYVLIVHSVCCYSYDERKASGVYMRLFDQCFFKLNRCE